MLEYARTMKSNHPHLIYKRMKEFQQRFFTRNDTYNGLTPFQCLQVTNKTHYATNNNFSVVDLMRVIKVKSYLRINSLSCMIKAKQYFDLHQQLFMAYFASKVYINYHKSINDKDSKLSEKIGKVNNGKQVQQIEELKNYDPKYFVGVLQQYISMSENKLGKLKGTFMMGLFYWFVDKDFE